jgi:hypothetical protein
VKGIEYDFESGDHLFIEAGETEIICEATRQADLSNGKKTTLKKSILLRPTTRHILQFDLSTAGNVEVNISFDGEIVETIVLDVELNDKA